MIKKLLFLAAGAMIIVSCAKLESDSQVFENLADNCESVSIPLVNEGEGTATKAYYYEDSSYWTYLWEDFDTFNYFTYSGSNHVGNGSADVLKSSTSTLVSYAASDLQIGNKIYSYFLQRDLWMNEIENDDPNDVTLVIPTLQVTTRERESFRDPIDYSFDVTGLSLDNQSAEGDAGILNLGNVSIPDNTLYFRITNFNPAYTYKCSVVDEQGGYSDFTYDSNGNASVIVSFDRYPTGELSQFTELKIYNDSNKKNYVQILVSANRTKANGTLKDGRISKYTVEKTTRATSVGYATSYGSGNPYPIRDAMPCASKGKLITSSLLQYPEDIANSMTMYMLGSAAEFRIYSSTGAYEGEDILKVVFTTSNPCAGYCHYDIQSESLAITGYDENQIVSDVEVCGYKVPRTKLGEESVYMVLAPGTYNATIEVYTKDSDGYYKYSFHTNNQTFTRATKKPFSVNLESANAVRSSIEPDEGASTGGDDEEGEL